MMSDATGGNVPEPMTARTALLADLHDRHRAAEVRASLPGPTAGAANEMLALDAWLTLVARHEWSEPRSDTAGVAPVPWCSGCVCYLDHWGERECPVETGARQFGVTA